MQKLIMGRQKKKKNNKPSELADGKCQLAGVAARDSAMAERGGELRVNRSLSARLWRWGLIGEAISIQ